MRDLVALSKYMKGHQIKKLDLFIRAQNLEVELIGRHYKL